VKHNLKSCYDSRRGKSVSLSEYISPLVGRFVLAWYFLSQAWMAGHQWDETVSGMAARQVPAAPLLLAIAIVVMALGAFSLIFGYHARHGAMLLFAFVLIVSVVMHPFWKITDATRAADYELFARNVAIAGGLLMIVGLGPGRFALDNRGQRRRD
jgi:putative oxidoreductase